MKKFIVETYYTCTFKTVHTLDELNDKELAKIDQRKDGEVEVIEVKLNNRKTKKIGAKKESDNRVIKQSDSTSNPVTSQMLNTKNISVNNTSLNNNVKSREKI